MWRRIVARCAAMAITVLVTVPAIAAGAEYELQVKQDFRLLMRGTAGTLVFTDDGVAFKPTGGEQEAWTYLDLRQIQILSPTRVALLTYGEAGATRFWRDERLEFVVTQGQVSPDLVAQLFAHAGKTVVTAVVPPGLCCSEGDVHTAWRRSGADAQGVLSVYASAVVFRGARPEDTRVWRAGDLVVLRVDPARLEIVALEGGGGNTRRFLFELKEQLPKDLYERDLGSGQRARACNTASRVHRRWPVNSVLTLVAMALSAVMIGPSSGAAQELVQTRPAVDVVHAPKCPCCARWAAHLEAHGFSPNIREVADAELKRVKIQWRVPKALTSCHSARVGRYVIEEHIPADVILQLLGEQPDVLGIAVPGMPEGSPGMDKDKTKAKDQYTVIAFSADGGTATYASR